MPSCPECQSQKTWKDGFRYVQGQTTQTYLCRVCGYRFSENHYKESQTINSRQICVTQTKGTKNLVKVEPQTENALRESTQTTKGQIISFAWHLKKLGRRETTIQTYCTYLEVLSKYGNINNPDSVNLALAAFVLS